VQIFAFANGLLSGVLFAAVIAKSPAWQRAVTIVVAASLVAGATPAVLGLLFKNLGSSVTDIVVMFVMHAPFLLAALVPLRRVWRE
jgi:hypothetical protein